jgi:hypothetical protein
MLDCSGCKPWWLTHSCPPHLQERRCGWFYVRCVFHIQTGMCSLWRSLVLEVDVNLYGLTTSNCRVDGRSVTCTIFCIWLLQWMYTLIVDPLFSTTSTRAEVWVVLCELCFSHPRVDVYAHMWWKWMLTYTVWPLRCAEWMEGHWPNHFLHMFVTVDVHPDGWTTVFHHIYKSRGVAGFIGFCELSLSHPWVDVYVHMCWKWMLTYTVWPLRCAEWMEGLWPNHFLHMDFTVDVNPDGWTTGFMWDVSFTSQCGCVFFDAHLCLKWMVTYMVWPLQFAEWMEGLWPIPLSALCLLQWM